MGKSTVENLITLALGAVIGFVIACLQGLFQAEAASDVMRILSDGYFVSGGLLLAGAGLRWAANGGTFDGLGYTFKSAFGRMTRDYENQKVSFAQYREEREKKNKSAVPMLISGLVYFALSLVFLMIYSRLTG